MGTLPQQQPDQLDFVVLTSHYQHSIPGNILFTEQQSTLPVTLTVFRQHSRFSPLHPLCYCDLLGLGSGLGFTPHCSDATAQVTTLSKSRLLESNVLRSSYAPRCTTSCHRLLPSIWPVAFGDGDGEAEALRGRTGGSPTAMRGDRDERWQGGERWLIGWSFGTSGAARYC